MMENITLLQGDCLDLMSSLPAISIDLILADLPYGTTHLDWDRPIPFEPLWAHYRRLLNPCGAVVLTASQPFTTDLIQSNRDWFKYCWVWEKSIAGGVFNCKHRPLKAHEDVVVFSPASAANGSANPMKYRPQGVLPGRRKRYQAQDRDSSFVSSRPAYPAHYDDQGSNYPRSILKIGNHNGAFWGRTEKATQHATQKPVALMEYLVRTYSDEGDTVLDNCLGSGTTGVACVNTGRKFIGIEIKPEFFAVAEHRIREASESCPLFV
jgi:site-specific DNA-methyltransferase (adenine-specific)